MKKRKVDRMTVFLTIILILLFVVSLVMPGEKMEDLSSDFSYEVILPEGYEESEQKYPVIYVMPQDGYAKDDSGLAELLQEHFVENGEMILVKVSFGKNAEICESMSVLVDEVDAAYRTMKGNVYRALVGTGVGGYLSYVVGLNKTTIFSVIGSVRGDFVSDENPWYGLYGDVYEKIQKKGASEMEKIYTYMDAPVEDTWTDMEGSTDDLGVLFIDFATSSESHEFTVRPGAFTKEFLEESAIRLVNRFTRKMLPKVEMEEDITQESSIGEQIDPSYPQIDLTGEWYFQYVGKYRTYDIEELTKEEYSTWSVVEPGHGNWKKGYGNINDDTVKTSYGADYFDYFIVGSGYYVKTFEVPADFQKEELYLAIGYVDDRCEVFLNGQRIGATGMDENGRSTQETT